MYEEKGVRNTSIPINLVENMKRTKIKGDLLCQQLILQMQERNSISW